MKKKVVINIFSGLLAQIIAILYGFIVPILLIKNYGSNTNGLVSSITQFISYISLLQFGIGPVIKNALFEPIANKDKEKIADILGSSNIFFKRIAYLLILYMLTLCIIFPLINNEFPALFSISLIIIISFGTFFEYFLGMTYRLFLTSNQKNYIVDFINIFGHIISLIIIVILVKANRSIQSVKIVGSTIFLIKPLLMKYYFDKKIGIKINTKSNYKFKNKWNGFAHHIAATIQSNTDVVILTIFNTLTNVSIYAIYNLIINGLNGIILSLTNGIDGYFGKILINNNSNVSKKFNLYSFFFYTLTTIIIGCSMILITPFVAIYTADINDANYVQWIFGYVLVFAEFNYVIRYPFSTLVYSKGHFKETTKYAIIEPIVNIIVSIILVKKFGLVGVAIGTFISMPIRSFGFIYHGVKHILKEPLIKHIKIIIVSYLEMIIIFLFRNKLIFVQSNNYIEWLLMAIIVFSIISTFIITINLIIFVDIKQKKLKY